MTAGRTAMPAAAAAAHYDAWFDTAWGAYAWAVESAAVLKALGPLPGLRIVDVGCGTGRLLARLLTEGAVAMGADNDPRMLERAATRARGRVVRADAARLPLADGSVHAAVAVTVLEFTADPAGVLAEMARVTRPGGRLVVGVLNPSSPWGWTDRGRRGRAAWAGTCFLPRTELLGLGRRHGVARVTGALYGWRRMPQPRVLGPALEGLRLLAPRAGAFQLLTVDLPDGAA